MVYILVNICTDGLCIKPGQFGGVNSNTFAIVKHEINGFQRSSHDGDEIIRDGS